MKKYKRLLLLLIPLLIPTITYAECSKEEIQHFKEIEDEYKITYEFNKETKLYTLTFHVAEPETYDFIAVTEDIFSGCKVLNNTTVECNNIKEGNYDFQIIGLTNSCNDTLKKETIVLTKYNNYSEDPLCNGIEEFVLCQPTYEKDIDYETFVSRVNTYKKSKQEKETKVEKEEPKQENPIINYIKNNLIQTIVIAVFIVMVIITIILTAQSIKKSRRLE